VTLVDTAARPRPKQVSAAVERPGEEAIAHPSQLASPLPSRPPTTASPPTTPLGHHSSLPAGPPLLEGGPWGQGTSEQASVDTDTDTGVQVQVQAGVQAVTEEDAE
jgi:hypothetical protein